MVLSNVLTNRELNWSLCKKMSKRVKYCNNCIRKFYCNNKYKENYQV